MLGSVLAAMNNTKINKDRHEADDPGMKTIIDRHRHKGT